MADNPAHVTPGPGPDPLEAAFPPAPEAEHAARTDLAEAPAPGVGESTALSSSDVELVGRSAAAPAQSGERTATPVLVGASSGTWTSSHGAVVSGRGEADSKPERRAGSGPDADFPVWSFREGTARDRVAAPPVDRNQVELPFAPAQPDSPAEPTVRSQPLFGPIGRPRSALVVALLSTVTLGVYALVWHHRVNRELEEFDPKLHSRPMRSTVALAIPWLVGLLVTVAGAVLVVAARLSVNVPLASHVTSTQADYMLAGLAAVPYLVLLVPFSLIAVVMTLERVRCVEEHVGTTTDRQVRAVGATLLLLVPVIGGLLLLGMAQRRLNAIWDAVAPTGRLLH